MRIIFALLLCALPTFAASPAQCFAVGNNGSGAPATGIYNWTDNIWADTALHNPGTCAASGGTAVTVEGQTATLAAGRPGAAGLLDYISINTGVVVHVTAGLGVQTGDVATAGSDGIIINATNQTTFGALVVDAHAKIVTNGQGTAARRYAVINQYAVLQIMPGGHWEMSSTSTGGPTLLNYGRLYIGCADQTAYPSPFCSGVVAGGWVSASVGSTLNITAQTALPTGLAVGDLVELDRIPQRFGTFPYSSIDNVTPPPPLPVMPTSNDTGTATANICGTATDCLIPESTQLCVVGITGLSISVGWPHGGNPTDAYCDGTETVAGITGAGSGLLWLKQPAYFWGSTSILTWATAGSSTPSAVSNPYDGARGVLVLAGAGGFWYGVSNLAHTGPGRKGDADLTFNSGSFGAGNGATVCTLNSIAAVTTSGCYIDYTSGVVYYPASLNPITANVSWVGAAAPPSTGAFTYLSVRIPAGARSYNEVVVENSDLRYMGTALNSLAIGVLALTVLPNTANNHVAFRNNSLRYAWNVVGLGITTQDASHPLELTGNSIFPAYPNNSVASWAMPWGSPQANVDISHNYADLGSFGFFTCFNNSATPTNRTLTNFTFTDNYVTGMFLRDDNSCNYPSGLIQQNRLSFYGNAAPGTAYTYGLYGLLSLDTAHPLVVRNNYFYSQVRIAMLGSNTDFHHNYAAFVFHHGLTMGRQGYAANLVNYIANAKVHDNVLAEYLAGSSTACIEQGYNQMILIDSPRVYSNTCLGTQYLSAILPDDGPDQSVVLIHTDDQIFNNVVTATGTNTALGKSASNANAHISQNSLAFTGFNSVQGTNPMYAGIPSPNNNHVPNPEWNRNVLVTDINGNYNTDPARNLQGIVIQNPTYSVNKTGSSVRLTVNSASDITAAWSLNGSSWGPEVQLGWQGAGYTYTLGSITDPGANYDFLTITAAQTTPGSVASPFTAYTNFANPIPIGCPSARWAKITSAAGTIPVGTAFMIAQCLGTGGSATNQLTIIPRDTRLVANDVFTILGAESPDGGGTVHLYDAGGTDYIDIGIDARVLPTSTATDTGINLTLTDYCASGCGSPSVIAGLPVNTAPGSNLPLVPVRLPELGGSAEDAFNRGYYEPLPYLGWKTAGSTGSYIGAVPPKVIWQQPAGIGAWPTVF